MRIFSLSLVLCLLMVGCTTRKRRQLPTGVDELSSSLYVVDPAHDTTIRTTHGALLTIPAGALEGNAPVHLVVKEAYTIADMIRGGLVTTSKEGPLTSGGMIYISAADGSKVRILKPIKVAIPTSGLVDGMQVYKGVRNDKGMIDWVDPKGLLPNPADSALARGKAIFLSSCSPCHGLAKVITGPPLAWIGDREPDKKWLHDFIVNNYMLFKQGDPYACYLRNKYASAMPVYPNLSDRDVDNLLMYISNASQGIDSNTVANDRRSFDSCGCRRRKGDSAALSSRTVDDTASLGTSSEPSEPSMDNAGAKPFFYEFEANDFGWFNCDRLFKGMPGVEESELTVRVAGSYGQQGEVYLVIPGMKVLIGGDFPGGGMLLPQGVPALILCMGESDGQTFWGKTQFVIGRKQEIVVEPKVMSKEDITTAIRDLHIEKLSAGQRDSILAGSRMAGGSQPCDCSCGLR